MQTVFSMFKGFMDADAAVRELQANGVKADATNVLVHAQTAKSNLDDVNFARAHVDASAAIGEQELSGLALLVANKQPVEVPGLGTAYVAGQMATILASSTATSNRTGDNVASVLVSYGVPAQTADQYTDTIKQGGVLLWVRSEDQLVGTISSILHRHNGQAVITNQ